MPAIAKVVVEIALDREFDYRIPPELQGALALGSRVRVPFGRRVTSGYVVGLAEQSERAELKPVLALIGAKPFLDERMLRLARWVAEYYCAPVELAVRAVLPGAVRDVAARFKERLFVRPTPGPAAAADGTAAWRQEAPKQAAVLDLVTAAGGLFLQEALRAAATTAATVQALVRRGLVVVERQTTARDPLAQHTILRGEPLALMPQQAEALAVVKQAIDTGTPPVVLVHGVTGSGKTEIYLQAIDHVLRQDKGAIVLVPEIALTPQTVERFYSRFGEVIAVLHSHLSGGERHDEWHRIQDGRARIAIGARSAVFAPVRRLGLIVVDEEHDGSYKQEEAPRYHARDVAVMRGHLDGCAVLLGSATPALESLWNVRRGKYQCLSLPHRVDHRRMPSMQVVDMRVEAERTGHVNVFSRALLAAIRLRLERAEQTMLFLNRRGYATSLLCPRCGYVAACEQCSVSCTYHRTTDDLRCHICGAVRKVPARCPGCGDPAFKFAGVGTQRVEAAVAKLFPKARVQRMDADATSGKDAHRRILGDFRTGKIDILVGTQMIAKGLHFPNVTLIGVVYADLSLHLPDFRAGERTFQLLTQVAGRAGRGEVPGEVIVQTYTPFHVAIQAARRLDYEGFCDQELEFRKELGYPPFRHLVCVGIKGLSEPRVVFAAEAFAGKLKAALAGQATVAGPAAAPLARAKGYYRYQVMARAPTTRAVVGPLKAVLKEFKWPAQVTCTVDVDALSLM